MLHIVHMIQRRIDGSSAPHALPLAIITVMLLVTGFMMLSNR